MDILPNFFRRTRALVLSFVKAVASAWPHKPTLRVLPLRRCRSGYFWILPNASCIGGRVTGSRGDSSGAFLKAVTVGAGLNFLRRLLLVGILSPSPGTSSFFWKLPWIQRTGSCSSNMKSKGLSISFWTSPDFASPGRNGTSNWVASIELHLSLTPFFLLLGCDLQWWFWIPSLWTLLGGDGTVRWASSVPLLRTRHEAGLNLLRRPVSPGLFSRLELVPSFSRKFSSLQYDLSEFSVDSYRLLLVFWGTERGAGWKNNSNGTASVSSPLANPGILPLICDPW